MSLVPSLLQAIVGVDGEALVMHAGDKPYVVAPSGQIELASRGLTLDAVNGIVSQLLPADALRSLEEFGAIQQELAALSEFPGESFTVVAARGGDDVWVEIRRRKVSDDDLVPADFFSSSPAGEPSQHSPAASTNDYSDIDDVGPMGHPGRSEEQRAPGGEGDEIAIDLEALEIPDATQLFDNQPPPAPEPDVFVPVAAAAPQAPALWQPEPVNQSQPVNQEPVNQPEPVYHSMPEPEPWVVPAPVMSAPVAFEPPPAVFAQQPPPAPVPEPVVVAPPVEFVPPPPVQEPEPPVFVAPPAPPAPAAAPVMAPIPVVVPPPVVAKPVVAVPPPPAPRPVMAPPIVVSPPPQPAVVLPMPRGPVRTDAPASIPAGVSGLDRLLRMAAARGASTLYLSSGARPSARMDGEIQALDGEPVYGAKDVESLLAALKPDRGQTAPGSAGEWISEIDGVGRVRCLSFHDHRGPGAVFRMIRPVSAEQLGLPVEVQSLALESGGLVLVTGSRQSGKSAVMSALVDLINHARRDYVITLENEIDVVHDQGTSFVSQREVGNIGDAIDGLAAAALREDPDVLVIESMRSAAVVSVALEAAASGRLVIGGFQASDSATTIDHIVNLFPSEQRRQVQVGLAENLRGIVAQVPVRKTTGGRLPAREVLLSTPAVASAIAEGRTAQLPAAIEAGRRHGMVSLNDSLAGLVQSGAVDAREAYRHAADRAGLLSTLKRLGLDTTAIERMA